MSEKLGKLEISELLELSKKTPKSALVLAHGEGLLEGIERVKHKLALAQLDNVRLREALEENHYCNSSEKAINLYNAAISKTPAQSLQEHANEVIEKCAKVVDESYAFDSDGFSKEIRALKT